MNLYISESESSFDVSSECEVIARFNCSKDAEEYVRMATAADVMERRGWWVVPYRGNPNEKRWFVRGNNLTMEIQDSEHPDPFTAIVEADKWYRENVEGKA